MSSLFENNTFLINDEKFYKSEKNNDYFCCTLKDGHKRLQDILYLIDLSPAAMITFAYTTILREMHLKSRLG